MPARDTNASNNSRPAMNLNAPIFVGRVGKGVHHIAYFDLHNPNKRRSFFSLLL